MYEKNGKFGLADIVVHKSQITLENIVYQFTMAGWHKCNELYSVSRTKTAGTCDNSYLILYTASGSGVLRTAEGEHHLRKDSVALIDCREDCEYHTAPGEIWEFYFIHFNQRDMPEIFDYLHRRGKLVQFFSNAYRIGNSISNIMEIKNNYSDGIDFKVSRLLSDIVYEILDESLDSYRPDPLVSSIVRYMRENYQQKISLQQMAGKFYISKNYLCNVFKTHLNQSPYAYLIKIRVEEANKLLLNTNYSIAQIAKLCGFATPNNFITTYRKIEGITPNQFRKKSRLEYLSVQK